MPKPFVLLDDARDSGAADARLYRNPVEIVVATRLEEVTGALDRVRHLSARGLHLAGYLTYEAGLALEPRLNALAPPPSGAPLLWFGAFAGYQAIPAATVPDWLAANASGGPAAIGPLEPQVSLGEYEAAFATLHRAIEAGDIYQANLTFPLEGPWRGDPLALYAALRPSAAAPYGGIVHDGTTWHLSFSPELCFSSKDGSVRVKPMKGTRPRGRDAGEDEALRADLAVSAKDRAENLMIVDLLRNDLSRVSTPGSVRVENPFAVETYPTVHQMVTTIHAALAPNRDAIDLLRALFPCGSITGAPKIRAMELIASVEPAPRHVYCGSIGHIEPGSVEPGGIEAGGREVGGREVGREVSGDAAFNVAIRTLRLTPDNTDAKAGRAVLGVGSAIVADSQVLPEWRECLVKGGFVRESTTTASPAQFDLIETMRFTPEDGIAHLDLHLERVRTSAETLGFSFDRHAVRNAIQALCFDAERPAKLRLVAARGGAYALELAALPEPLPTPATVAVLRLPVDSGDWRLAHKTSDRGFYDHGLSAARAAGAHEAVFLRDDGLVTEGCFTNLFVERDGVLLTPETGLGLLPGILRRALLDSGEAREARLTLDDLADGFQIGNALRGLMPARLLA